MADNQNWLTLNRYDGPSGTTQVTISAETCPDKTSRVATITFRAGNLVKRLKVTQGASYSAQIGISCSSYSVYVGTPVTFTVKVSNAEEYANYRWVVTVVGSGTTAGGGYTITPSDLSGNTAQKSFQLTNNTENSTKLTLMATLYDNAGEVIANSDAKTFYFYRNQQQDPTIQLIWQTDIYQTKEIEVNRSYRLKVIMSGVGTNALKYSAYTDNNLVSCTQGFIQTMGESFITITNNGFISRNAEDLCSVRVDLYDGNERVSGPNGFSVVNGLSGVTQSSEGKITITPSTQQKLSRVGDSITYTAVCDYDVNTYGFDFVKGHRLTQYSNCLSWSTGRTSQYGVTPAVYTGVVTYTTLVPETSNEFYISGRTTTKVNNEYLYTGTTDGILVEKDPTKLSVIWDAPDRSVPAKLTINYHMVTGQENEVDHYTIWWKKQTGTMTQDDWDIEDADSSTTTTNNYLLLTKTELPDNIGQNYFFKIKAHKKASSQYADSDVTNSAAGWSLGLGTILPYVYSGTPGSYVYISSTVVDYVINTQGDSVYLRIDSNIPFVMFNNLFKNCTNYNFSQTPTNYYYFPGQDNGGIVSTPALPSTTQVTKLYDEVHETTCNCLYFVSGTTITVGGVQATTGDLLVYNGSSFVVVKRETKDGQPVSANIFDFKLDFGANQSTTTDNQYLFYCNGSASDGWGNNRGGSLTFIQYRASFFMKWTYYDDQLQGRALVYENGELETPTASHPNGVSDVSTFQDSDKYCIVIPTGYTQMPIKLIISSNFNWYIDTEDSAIKSGKVFLTDTNNNECYSGLAGNTELVIHSPQYVGTTFYFGEFTIQPNPTSDQSEFFDGTGSEWLRPIKIRREAETYSPSDFRVTIQGYGTYQGNTGNNIVIPTSGTTLQMSVVTPNSLTPGFSFDADTTRENNTSNPYMTYTLGMQPTLTIAENTRQTDKNRWFRLSVNIGTTVSVTINTSQAGIAEFVISPDTFNSGEVAAMTVTTPSPYNNWYVKSVKKAGSVMSSYDPVSNPDLPYISTLQQVTSPVTFIDLGKLNRQPAGVFYVHTENVDKDYEIELAAIEGDGTSGSAEITRTIIING